ncbi:MAG TPA: sigma factor-like helix-turn-helix DNA-binding protein [Bacteriovoracaceae bacterium]|nr:sigma factor-like helix-turn-helix DNA-binding protein [Bacteriovoracaceae bacterium]
MEDFTKTNNTDNIEKLHHVLPTLSKDAQAALHMRYWESMSIEEIARAMGKTWDVTDRLIESTLKKLKHLLTDESDHSLANAA